ncbi:MULTISPECIES: hypothetical protein [Aphanothece]|uniref:hypothetical protein n=1 Tax=Aphanothece TaxID=1121 RepID=UPI0039849CA6
MATTSDPVPDPLQGTLETMRRRLRSHSPLEDLGPLFGPEAQGRGENRAGEPSPGQHGSDGNSANRG